MPLRGPVSRPVAFVGVVAVLAVAMAATIGVSPPGSGRNVRAGAAGRSATPRGPRPGGRRSGAALPSAATTVTPTTAVPATAVPTTAVPTTAVPTTALPTTALPTTAVLTTAVPTTAVPTTALPTTAVPSPVSPLGGAIAIGDSVLEDVALYAPATLTSRGVVINAAVSRQWRTGESIVASLRTSGRLPPVVVVALGTNSSITTADFDAMMAELSGVSRVVFMTVTGPAASNNAVIETGVARYSQDTLADWWSMAAGHPTWFAPDHVHIGPAGATALGQLLASRL